MDNNNWRPVQAENIDSREWRTQLPPDSRQRIVNKMFLVAYPNLLVQEALLLLLLFFWSRNSLFHLCSWILPIHFRMETLKRHLPFCGQEGLQELQKIAVRFEEKIYTAATSQSDYLRKISWKMMTMESESQNTMANTLQAIASGINENPSDQVMDNNNWRPVQAENIDSSEWKTQLQPDSRQRIVNKIVEYLKRHLPFSGQEGLSELRVIAARFEEKIYTAATSQSDYLRKISLKLLTMELKYENTMANTLQPIAGGTNENPSDPASLDFTAQTSHPNVGHGQEETYQKIKSMRDMYLPEITDLCRKITLKLQQHVSLPQQLTSDQLDKLRYFKAMMEQMILFLQFPKTISHLL